MFKYFSTLIIILLILASNLFSQTNNSKLFYLSINAGLYITSLENFDETYDSKLGFVYGLGAGLQLSSKSYLFGKATLFSKSGIPYKKTYDIVNNELVLVSKVRDGSADYSQWVFNAGYLYNFDLSEFLELGINGGITYSNFTENINDSNGINRATRKGNGIFGFFIGTLLEKSFQNIPFTIFLETQYNFIRYDILGIVSNYGGLNLNVGGKYYFGNRKMKE